MDEFNQLQGETIDDQNNRIKENFSRVMDIEFSRLVDEMRKREEKDALNKLADSIEDRTNLEDFFEQGKYNNTGKYLFTGLGILVVISAITQSDVAIDATFFIGLCIVCFAMIDITRKVDVLFKEERHQRILKKAKQLEAEERLGYKLDDSSIEDPIADGEKKSLAVYSTSITDRLEEN